MGMFHDTYNFFISPYPFSSHLVFMACLHNAFENDVFKLLQKINKIILEELVDMPTYNLS